MTPAEIWETGKTLSRGDWTRARALAHLTIADAALAAGVDRSLLSRWENAGQDHPPSLAALYHRDLTPDDAFEEIVESARRFRAAHTSRVAVATPEGALSVAMERAAEMLAAGVRALRDKRVSADERRRNRPHLVALAKAIRTVLRAWDEADKATGGADVVPMLRAGAR